MTDNIGRDAAIKTLCDARLHQSFILPVSALQNTNIKEPLRVTYSDIGDSPSRSRRNQLDGQTTESEQCVVLFIGGLMGGRYTHYRSGSIAQRLRVRIITIDRPGFGGSTPVPVEQRLAVHLATVPALLAHLGIAHVTLASHSGGAPYLMQTLLAYRGLLHPTRPHVVLLAPWVHPDDGGAPLMSITARLPAGLIRRFHSVATFANGAFAVSSGLAFWRAGALAVAGGGDADDEEENEDRLEAAALPYLDKLVMQYFFAENTQGCSDDALLYLRKKAPGATSGQSGATDDWLDWTRVSAAVAEQERSRRRRRNLPEQQQPSETNDSNAEEKLKIDALHCEKDIMVGAKGAKHFDACFGGHSEDLCYTSKVMKGVNHDSILDPSLGVSEVWLRDVAQRWYG